jgi:hypothetical protein
MRVSRVLHLLLVVVVALALLQSADGKKKKRKHKNKHKKAKKASTASAVSGPSGPAVFAPQPLVADVVVANNNNHDLPPIPNPRPTVPRQITLPARGPFPPGNPTPVCLNTIAGTGWQSINVLINSTFPL